MRDDLFINRRLRRKIPMKMKKWPQLEAVTVTAKQLTFLDSALKMEEKTLYKPWGVSSSRTNSVFLKCGIVHGQDLFCIYSKTTDDFFKSFWGITRAMSEIMRNPSKSSVDEICHISQLFVYKSHWGLLRLNQSIYQKYIYAKIFVIHRRSFDMFIIFSYVSCLFTYKPKCKQKIDREFLDGHFLARNH